MTLAEFQYAAECTGTTCTEQRTLVGVTSSENSFCFENFLAGNLIQTFFLAAIVWKFRSIRVVHFTTR